MMGKNPILLRDFLSLGQLNLSFGLYPSCWPPWWLSKPPWFDRHEESFQLQDFGGENILPIIAWSSHSENHHKLPDQKFVRQYCDDSPYVYTSYIYIVVSCVIYLFIYIYILVLHPCIRQSIYYGDAGQFGCNIIYAGLWSFRPTAAATRRLSENQLLEFVGKLHLLQALIEVVTEEEIPESTSGKWRCWWQPPEILM